MHCLLLNTYFVSETRPIMQYIRTVSISPLLSKISKGFSSTKFDISTLQLRCGAASLHNWNLKKSWTFWTFNVGWLHCPWTLGRHHPIRGCQIREVGVLYNRAVFQPLRFCRCLVLLHEIRIILKVLSKFTNSQNSIYNAVVSHMPTQINQFGN